MPADGSIPLPQLQPTDTFRCEQYRCTLTVRACLDRQNARVAIRAVAIDKAAKKFQAKGTKPKGGEPTAAEKRKDAEEKRQREKARLERETWKEVVRRTVEKAEATKENEKIWDVFFAAVFDGIWHSTVVDVCERRKLEMKGKSLAEATLKKYAEGLTPAQRREAESWRVIAECAQRVYLEVPPRLFWKSIHRWQWAVAHVRLHLTAAADAEPLQEAA